jgi:hypothetical protein
MPPFQELIMSYLLSLARASLAVLCLLPALVLADPPARVGRLAYLEGGVDFRVDRDAAASPAAVNWPISSGAVLETDRRGRAEVWVGSTAYRVASNSRTEFAILDDRQVTLQVHEGGLAVSILDRDQADDVTVHTPDGSIRFAVPGRYRIDVFSDHSELSAHAGQASLDDRGRMTPVSAGQKVSFQGGGRMLIESDADQDGFDRWVAERENATLASVTRRHVSPYMTGYQDLDAYGDWRPEDEYGSVWYPRSVGDDWAPYRFGRWAWVEPWGWTWIDQAPWGFTPFHYGRWALIRGRWGWLPGHHATRPVYAPALVGWLGNPGWSVSFGFGSAPAVGWFPLAPREVFVPRYRHSAGYVRQINVTHVRDVNIIDRTVRFGGHERFAHRETARAVTVVPANLVREGRPINPTEVRRAERLDLGRAPLAGRAPGADWLAPPPAAIRARPEGRREQPDFPGRRADETGTRGQPAVPVRDFDAPTRRGDGSSPRREFRDERLNTAPSGATREPGRDSPRDERQGARDATPARQEAQPAAPILQTAPQAAPAPRDRDFRREMRDEQRQSPRSGEAPAFRLPTTPQSTTPAVQAPVPQAAPQTAPPPREREFRREMRDDQRQSPRSGEAPAFRPPATLQSTTPAVQAPVQQAAPPLREQEFRREMRDDQRQLPRSGEAPAFRPPATPQPSAPAVQAPVPQAAPQPAPPPRERDFRREMRDEPRPVPRPSEAPMARQPEAPAVRAPVPQAAPQPAPPPRGEFRREMREEARPAPRPSEAPAFRPPPPPPPPQVAPQPQPQAVPAPQESRGRDRGRGGDRDERGERGR